MTNDETMARIEAALDDYAEACVQEFRSGVIDDVRTAVEAKTAALALIREALPKPWLPDGEGTHQVTMHYDGSGRVEGCTFTLTAKDGTVTRFVPEPKPDAEHERAVEAWRRRAMAMTNKHRMFLLEKLEIDEALRLMRARPASGKDEAAGELLRAAKEAWPWVYGHPKQSDELWQAIAKAERAGIKP